MPPKTIKHAIKDMLARLSKEDFDNFCHQLVDRREEPQVKLNKVEGKSLLVISDVLVSTFTEAKAAGVAEELLRDIGCSEEAERFVKVTSGLSSNPASSGSLKTKACLDKGDPTFRKTLTRRLETQPSQEALNHAADQRPLQAAGPGCSGKKPQEVEAEAKARVLSEGGDPGDKRLVLSRCTIQFGQYKGQTFKWLLENDVSYVAYLLESHQQQRQDRNQSPLNANKDSLTQYAMAYPEFLKELRFHRGYQRSRQSGKAGDALVGFGRYRSQTLQELYESKDKDISSYVEFLRTLKSTCECGSKMEFAIKYILQQDRKHAAPERNKRATKRKRAQSTGGQSTSASRSKKRTPRKSQKKLSRLSK